jgi:hypothetical protein
MKTWAICFSMLLSTFAGTHAADTLNDEKLMLEDKRTGYSIYWSESRQTLFAKVAVDRLQWVWAVDEKVLKAERMRNPNSSLTVSIEGDFLCLYIGERLLNKGHRHTGKR